MNYQFTNNWFELHKSSWTSILGQKLPSNLLEIGSYEGQSAVFSTSLILDMQLNSISLTCIDTWQGAREHMHENMKSVEERFDYNMRISLKKYNNRLSLKKIKNKSCIGLSRLYAAGGENKYDFIYVDGSHDACDVLFDAVASFKLLQVNGLMCFDDFLWHSGDRNPLHTPRLAIESFISCYREKIFLFDSGQSRQCWLMKTAL